MDESNSKVWHDNADRLKKIAFWYWEYVRRNSLYKKYSVLIRNYHKILHSKGLAAYINPPGEFDKTYADDPLRDLGRDWMSISYRDRLIIKHGNEVGRILLRYTSLMSGFKKHFGRNYKDHEIGLDTSDALESLLLGKNVFFETNDAFDVLAVLNFSKQGALFERYLNKKLCSQQMNVSIMTQIKSVGEKSRAVIQNEIDHLSRRMEAFYSDNDNIRIDATLNTKRAASIGHEIHVLSTLKKIAQTGPWNHRLDVEVMSSIYVAALSGKQLKSASETRLIALWLWDKAHEENELIPAPFKDVYRIFKDKLNNKKEDIAKSWEQAMQRPGRVRKNYELTEFSIKNCTVTHMYK